MQYFALLICYVTLIIHKFKEKRNAKKILKKNITISKKIKF